MSTAYPLRQVETLDGKGHWQDIDLGQLRREQVFRYRDRPEEDWRYARAMEDGDRRHSQTKQLLARRMLSAAEVAKLLEPVDETA